MPWRSSGAAPRSGRDRPRCRRTVGGARTADRGQHNWVPIGPRNVGGRVRAIAVRPEHARRHVRRPGVRWHLQVARRRRVVVPALARRAVPVDGGARRSARRPAPVGVVWAGTGETEAGGGETIPAAGVLRSADGGATWTQPDAGQAIRAPASTPLAAHPTNPDVCWAATDRRRLPQHRRGQAAGPASAATDRSATSSSSTFGANLRLFVVPQACPIITPPATGTPRAMVVRIDDPDDAASADLLPDSPALPAAGGDAATGPAAGDRVRRSHRRRHRPIPSAPTRSAASPPPCPGRPAARRPDRRQAGDLPRRRDRVRRPGRVRRVRQRGPPLVRHLPVHQRPHGGADDHDVPALPRAGPRSPTRTRGSTTCARRQPAQPEPPGLRDGRAVHAPRRRGGRAARRPHWRRAQMWDLYHLERGHHADHHDLLFAPVPAAPFDNGATAGDLALWDANDGGVSWCANWPTAVGFTDGHRRDPATEAPAAACPDGCVRSGASAATASRRTQMYDLTQHPRLPSVMGCGLPGQRRLPRLRRAVVAAGARPPTAASSPSTPTIPTGASPRGRAGSPSRASPAACATPSRCSRDGVITGLWPRDLSDGFGDADGALFVAETASHPTLPGRVLTARAQPPLRHPPHAPAIAGTPSRSAQGSRSSTNPPRPCRQLDAGGARHARCPRPRPAPDPQRRPPRRVGAHPVAGPQPDQPALRHRRCARPPARVRQRRAAVACPSRSPCRSPSDRSCRPRRRRPRSPTTSPAPSVTPCGPCRRWPRRPACRASGAALHPGAGQRRRVPHRLDGRRDGPADRDHRTGTGRAEPPAGLPRGRRRRWPRCGVGGPAGDRPDLRPQPDDRLRPPRPHDAHHPRGRGVTRRHRLHPGPAAAPGPGERGASHDGRRRRPVPTHAPGRRTTASCPPRRSATSGSTSTVNPPVNVTISGSVSGLANADPGVTAPTILFSQRPNFDLTPVGGVDERLRIAEGGHQTRRSGDDAGLRRRARGCRHEPCDVGRDVSTSSAACWPPPRPCGCAATSTSTRPRRRRRSACHRADVRTAGTGLVWAGDAAGRLYRSRDDGERWSLVAGPFAALGAPVDAIAVRPDKPDVVLAGTYLQGSHPTFLHLLQRSDDGGEHWAPVATPIVDAAGGRVGIRALEFDPAHPEHVYAATDIGVHRSVDCRLDLGPVQRGPARTCASPTSRSSRRPGRCGPAAWGRGVYERHLGDRPAEGRGPARPLDRLRRRVQPAGPGARSAGVAARGRPVRHLTRHQGDAGRPASRRAARRRRVRRRAAHRRRPRGSCVRGRPGAQPGGLPDVDGQGGGAVGPRRRRAAAGAARAVGRAVRPGHRAGDRVRPLEGDRGPSGGGSARSGSRGRRTRLPQGGGVRGRPGVQLDQRRPDRPPPRRDPRHRPVERGRHRGPGLGRRGDGPRADPGQGRLSRGRRRDAGRRRDRRAQGVGTVALPDRRRPRCDERGQRRSTVRAVDQRGRDRRGPLHAPRSLRPAGAAQLRRAGAGGGDGDPGSGRAGDRQPHAGVRRRGRRGHQPVDGGRRPSRAGPHDRRARWRAQLPRDRRPRRRPHDRRRHGGRPPRRGRHQRDAGVHAQRPAARPVAVGRHAAPHAGDHGDRRGPRAPRRGCGRTARRHPSRPSTSATRSTANSCSAASGRSSPSRSGAGCRCAVRPPRPPRVGTRSVVWASPISWRPERPSSTRLRNERCST